MNLHTALASGLLESHPEEAAAVLDSLPVEDVLPLLAEMPAPVSARVVNHMAIHRAAATLSGLEPSCAGMSVACLEHDLATNILRRMDPDARERMLESMQDGTARSLRALLRFPEGTAGALMDPNVLALPDDLTVEGADAHIRESPENVRYNLPIVDRSKVLVGVLNLRELLLAPRTALLKSIAHPDVLSIPARADEHEILAHPAWREARSVPVVDETGVYLGAVRYQTLRRLEEARREVEPESYGATAEALGDLFSAGIAGAFAALASTAGDPLPRSPGRKT